MEIDYVEQTIINVLHGYIPDDRYDPVNMEENREYPKELNGSTEYS
jgi:hypothetical protein